MSTIVYEAKFGCKFNALVVYHNICSKLNKETIYAQKQTETTRLHAKCVCFYALNYSVL